MDRYPLSAGGLPLAAVMNESFDVYLLSLKVFEKRCKLGKH
jgi:hypothetical protein